MSGSSRNRPPVALTIAGSDSGGGAGIQADLKTFHAFGVFGTSAVTAVTVQNTLGVSGVQRIEPEIVAGQILAVAADLQPAACKSGMLADASIVEAVASALEEARIPAYVMDPVMVAASGDPLLEADAVAMLRDLLLPRATLVTPNLDEASILSQTEVRNVGEMKEAVERLLQRGAAAVLLKGGHLPGPEVVDVFGDGSGFREWRSSRIPVDNAHGTGCTLSAAIAAGLAHGRPLAEAVEAGLAYTRRAIASAPGLGGGNPPLNHWASP